MLLPGDGHADLSAPERRSGNDPTCFDINVDVAAVRRLDRADDRCNGAMTSPPSIAAPPESDSSRTTGLSPPLTRTAHCEKALRVDTDVLAVLAALGDDAVDAATRVRRGADGVVGGVGRSLAWRDARVRLYQVISGVDPHRLPVDAPRIRCPRYLVGTEYSA